MGDVTQPDCNMGPLAREYEDIALLAREYEGIALLAREIQSR